MGRSCGVRDRIVGSEAESVEGVVRAGKGGGKEGRMKVGGTDTTAQSCPIQARSPHSPPSTVGGLPELEEPS